MLFVDKGRDASHPYDLLVNEINQLTVCQDSRHLPWSWVS